MVGSNVCIITVICYPETPLLSHVFAIEGSVMSLKLVWCCAVKISAKELVIK